MRENLPIEAGNDETMNRAGESQYFIFGADASLVACDSLTSLMIFTQPNLHLIKHNQISRVATHSHESSERSHERGNINYSVINECEGRDPLPAGDGHQPLNLDLCPRIAHLAIRITTNTSRNTKTENHPSRTT